MEEWLGSLFGYFIRLGFGMALIVIGVIMVIVGIVLVVI